MFRKFCRANIARCVPSVAMIARTSPRFGCVSCVPVAGLPTTGMRTFSTEEHADDFDGEGRSSMRPPPAAAELRPGDWNCSNCSAHNFAKRMACFKCQTPKEGAVPHGMATPRGPSATMKQGDWICPSCQAHNFARRQMCLQCNSSRPGARPMSMGTGAGRRDTRPRPGDWTCKCGFSNFASRSTCLKCDGLKEEGTTSAPTMTASLGGATARPDDWICKHCGTNNFSKRGECFGCHQPKPE